jgi:membrane protein DedA with SNARE-associated domain
MMNPAWAILASLIAMVVGAYSAIFLGLWAARRSRKRRHG